jgi:FSR family fosmidomycin resistance protein-like MFS transporter
MNKKVIWGSISVYGMAHALVDGACAATIFAMGASGQIESQDLFLLIVLYSTVAFSTQPLFGLLVDKYRVPALAAAAGILLVAASTLLVQIPFLAASIASIGNALFHVGGGVTSLNLIPGKAALPGIYVAPGALGLLIGTLIGKGGHFVAWPFIVLLVGSAVLILRIPTPETDAHHRLPGNLRWFETIILLLLVSIGIRGVVGLSLIMPWKSDPVLLVVLTCGVALGKALGGILGDRYGWTKVALTGLIVSAPLLAFFSRVPFIAIIGAFFFNLTMPITLTCLAEMLPGKNGFAFGLTTLALIIGAWPTFTQLRVLTSNQLFMFSIVVASIAALHGGLKLYVDHFGDQTRVQQDQARL